MEPLPFRLGERFHSWTARPDAAVKSGAPTTSERNPPVPSLTRDDVLISDEDQALPRHRATFARSPDWFKVFVGLAVLAGVVLRVGVLRSHLGLVDSDEAIVGLMAHNVAEGHMSTFYWGQNYGGTAETFPLAIVISLLGMTRVALKLVVMAESAILALVVWRVAMRILDERRAAVAGVLTWVAPAPLVLFSTKEMLFYFPSLLFGFVALIAAFRLGERAARATDLALLGGALGLGWWTSPFIALFALPIAVVLTRTRIPRTVWQLGIGVGAALATSGPWWIWNLRHGFKSLQSSFHSTTPALERSANYVGRGVSFAIGFRRLDGAWMFSSLGRLAVLVVVVAICMSVWRRSSTSPAIDVIGIAGAAVVFALITLDPVWPAWRYFVLVSPFVLIAVSRLARTRLLAIAVIVGATALSAHSLDTTREIYPPTIESVAEVLKARGVHTCYADYWIAYRLAYASGGSIETTPFAVVRQHGWDARVRTASTSCYVFTKGQPEVGVVEKSLTGKAVPYRAGTVGDYTYVLVDRQVPPEAISPTPLGV